MQLFTQVQCLHIAIGARLNFVRGVLAGQFLVGDLACQGHELLQEFLVLGLHDKEDRFALKLGGNRDAAACEPIKQLKSRVSKLFFEKGEELLEAANIGGIVKGSHGIDLQEILK